MTVVPASGGPGRGVEGAEEGTEDKPEQAVGPLGAEAQQVLFDKELTVMLELQGQEPVSAMELMRAVRGLCGGLLACRATGPRSYEVTMTHVKGKDRLLDGFKIGDTAVLAKGLCNDELVVSFLNLPAYITDEEILKKLENWGVSPRSPIRRKMWPGTKIADGTRFLKVKFNEKVQSLPYSARFETAIGPEYFRVIHDRQARVCRMCLQPGHILRDCPEFTCHKCGVQGHYARECGAKGGATEEKCLVCCNRLSRCACKESESGGEESEELFSSGESSGEDRMSEGDEQCEEAGVAVRADLADAVPQEPLGPSLDGLGATELGGLAEGDCGLDQAAGRSSGPRAGGKGVTAGTSSKGAGQGAVPAVPQTPLHESSETEMDLDQVKQVRKLSMKRKQKKRLKINA